MTPRVTTLMCYVRDMQRSVTFYRDVLGLKLEMQSPGWSQFDLGNGIVLGLHPLGQNQSPAPMHQEGGWTIGFDVPDVKAAEQKLKAAGIHVHGYHDIPGAVSMSFHDFDGNKIDLYQHGVTAAQLGVPAH